MCVIAYCKHRKMTNLEIKNCFITNSDGIGIAWQKNGLVHFKKGFMSVDEFKKFYEDFHYLPHVIHFRNGTSGGKVAELTHPFKIDFDNPLEGRTKKGVLFHNGVLRDWRDRLSLVAFYCIKKGIKFPSGEFSDSRTIAILLNILGINYMETIDSGKFIIVLPYKLILYGSFVEEKGIYFSNASYISGKTYGYEYGYNYHANYRNDHVKKYKIDNKTGKLIPINK
ncbi:hypothetical protein J7J62_03950 [bacterium]|nr:hypothetical protein [bacterium]